MTSTAYPAPLSQTVDRPHGPADALPGPVVVTNTAVTFRPVDPDAIGRVGEQPLDPHPTAPPHPGGGTWAWELVTVDARVYADDTSGLLEHLHPGYRDLSDSERWAARYLIAILAQVHTQAVINSSSPHQRISEMQRAILSGPRHEPVLVTDWDCPVPLVLIRTDYAPASGVRPPGTADGMPANVWWIDPSDDVSLLTTLHQVGYVTVATSRR